MVRNLYCCKCGELMFRVERGVDKGRVRCRFCSMKTLKAWIITNGTAKRNKERRRIAVRKWARKNPEKVLELHREWVRKNPETCKEYNRRNNAKRRSTPEGRLIWALRVELRSALNGERKTQNTLTYIGKSPKDLMAYLMSINTDPNIVPENYGRYWHADHIVPVSHFDHADPKQVEACWTYSNLQPLEKTANLKKYNKIVPKEGT